MRENNPQMGSRSVASRELGAVRLATWQVLCPPGTDPYWIELVQRSGIPCGVAGLAAEPAAAGTLLFLPGPVPAADSATIALIRHLHANGAPVVAEPRCAAWLTGERTRRPRRRRTIGISGSGPLFAQCPTVRLPAVEVYVAERSGVGRIWPCGDPAIGIQTHGPAPVITLPLPEPQALLRSAGQMACFPVGDADARTAFEIVSAADHGAIRRLVENAIRLASFARGMPFIRLAEAPVGRTVGLALRVDADDYNPSATRQTLAALKAGNFRATWFLDVERHLDKGGVASVSIIADAGHEIQSHYFHHYTFRSSRRNRRNLGRSHDVLRAWGVEAKAAAAPFGTWNEGLHRAMQAYDITYSSEFSRIFDDSPSLLPVDHARNRLFVEDLPWQVPVHPICPALLLEAGLDKREVSEYFTRQLLAKLARGENGVFYGHPIGDLACLPELYARLREELEQHDPDGRAWQPTLGELFEFHRARRRQSLRVKVSAMGVQGECEGVAPLRIELPNGRTKRLHGGFSWRFDAATRADLAAGGSKLAAAVVPEAASMPSCFSAATRQQLRKRQRHVRLRRWVRELRRR